MRCLKHTMKIRDDQTQTVLLSLSRTHEISEIAAVLAVRHWTWRQKFWTSCYKFFHPWFFTTAMGRAFRTGSSRLPVVMLIWWCRTFCPSAHRLKLCFGILPHVRRQRVVVGRHSHQRIGRCAVDGTVLQRKFKDQSTNELRNYETTALFIWHTAIPGNGMTFKKCMRIIDTLIT